MSLLTNRAFLFALTVATVLAVAPRSYAQQPPIENMPGPLREVGFEQRLGDVVPANLEFTDAAANTVLLDQYFGDKPVVLALVYFECPMLCSMVLNGLVSSLDILTFDAGQDYEVVVVSFDPEEGAPLAAIKRQELIDRYDRPGTEAGFHFLTGDASSIRALTSAVGFSYKYDEDTGQFAHAAGITVLTSDRTVSRYLFGIEYAPKDLRLALVESAQGKVGGVVDQLLLYCYAYDPATGSYGAATMNILRIAGLFTVGSILAFILLSRRRDRRRERRLKEELAQS
jgi:protein SCO1